MKIKILVILLIGAATMLISAGCEEEHEHHGHYGGAYDGTYQGHGHDYYPQREGDWQRSDDWHPR